MDQWIRLDEDAARTAFVNQRNANRLQQILPWFTLLACGIGLWELLEGRYLTLLLPLLDLVLIRILFVTREHRNYEIRIHWILTAFFLAQLLFLRSLFWQDLLHPLDALFPILLLVFRLPAWPLTWILACLWIPTSGRVLWSLRSENNVELLLWAAGHTVLALVVLWLNNQWTGELRRQFVDTWRREQRHSRERQRMREEIGDARRIQLSMLPRQAPRFPGLDIAGISIPANEVGGDYYDYFPLDDQRLVVVVADVAGHGLASGLILSGLRSCLHLLLESPTEPVTVLQRLDRVVRQTAGKRHFVTMICAVFDLAERRVSLATAGHPPMLHAKGLSRQEVTVSELGTPSLPLGTPLPGNFQQQVVSFEPGDVFLLYTDGIAETCNDRTDAYGNDRLQDRLGQFARTHPRGSQRSVREIRDTLLSDIVQFKGDAEQTDDITVVTLRVEPEA